MKYNYPIKRAPIKERKISTSNRGMVLEDLINQSNEMYLKMDKAVIHKKPTPVQIVDVDYPSRNMAKIKEAYYKTPSTTDYNGIYKGYYIDFDAKMCNSDTSFPMSNIHEHQLRHLERIERHGGIGFIIIYLSKLGKIFILDTENLLKAENRAKTGGRKSITIDEIEEFGILVKESFPVRIPYLDAVDILIEKKKGEN